MGSEGFICKILLWHVPELVSFQLNSGRNGELFLLVVKAV